MVRVGVIHHDVFGLTCFRKFQDFLMARMCGERELFCLQWNVHALTVDRDRTCFQQPTTAGVTCLIAGEEDSVFAIVSQSIQVPEGRTTFQHARCGDDDVGCQCFLAI